MTNKNNNHSANELNITNEVGYLKALEKVLQVRLERKKLYGNAWKENADWELLTHIKNKVGRLEKFILDSRLRNQNYENEIDCLIDLINWSLFLLENKLEESK